MTRRAAVCAFAAYTALAALVTFPLVMHLTSALPHDLGDPLLSTAILWWNAHTMPLTDRWWNGFAFFPAPGMLAFSDHRLGESFIASPVQWLGGSDITAYNVTLLLTFPLCAVGAHALGFTLTRRHDAALVCGLGYGFNPYRIAHLEHLELLAAFGMPLALAALHRLIETRRRRWLVAFGLALTIQGLATSYFLLYFCVLLALWVLWFVDWRDWRLIAAIAAVALCCAALLSPIIIGYVRIHRNYAITRELGEVLAFSADLASLVAASPMLAVWGWTSRLATSERQLFPGLTVTVVAVAGALLALRRHPAGRERSKTLSTVFGLLGCAALAMAMSARVFGEWSFGPLRVSNDVFKPQSVALVFFVLSIAAMPAVRAAYGRRSALAFYLFASAFLFICSLGPKPTFLGTQILYEPPYAWLMRLPVFGTDVRAPARFAMPAVLALSAAAAVAFSQRASGRAGLRRIALAVVAGGIVTDTWTSGVPMPPVPGGWTPARASDVASVLELPLGDIEGDVAAMYRATRHERPTMNGYSGFTPPHYTVLRHALGEGDETAVSEMARTGPLLITVDRRKDVEGRWLGLVQRTPGAAAAGEEGHWLFFRVPAQPARDSRTCTGPAIAVAAVSGPPAVGDVRTIIDGDPKTAWVTRSEQRAGDTVTVTLAREERPCAVTLTIGARPEVYPRMLAVETSLDGAVWTSAYEGKMGGMTIAAALERPADSRITFPLPGTPATVIRLRLLASHPVYPWVMTGLVVNGSS
jgi:hypothetical protein